MVLPWVAARAIFKSSVGNSRKDKLLDWLAFLRPTVGLLVVLFAFIDFRDPEDIVGDAIGKVLKTAYTSISVVGILLLFAYPLARSRSEELARRGLRRMATRIASAAGAVVLLVACVALGAVVSGTSGQGGVRGSVVFWFVLLFLWMFLFIGCAFYWAARTCLWIAYFNPLLAPLGSSAITVILTTSEIRGGDSKGVPYPLWLTVTLCGLVTALGLAWVEYRHLRKTGAKLTTGVASSHDRSPEHVGER